jgi:hypothetical protein
MIENTAVAAVKAKSLLISGNLTDEQVMTLLAGYSTVDSEGVTVYDTTGCAIACLRALIGTVAVARSIGGISYSNEGVLAAIASLSKSRGGMVRLYHDEPDDELDEGETQL